LSPRLASTLSSLHVHASSEQTTHMHTYMM
jgi:hypothetical protein